VNSATALQDDTDDDDDDDDDDEDDDDDDDDDHELQGQFVVIIKLKVYMICMN